MSLLISGLMCCGTVSAQAGPGKISGTITDSTAGKPLDFITLNLLDASKTVVKVDYTKADGTFLFSGLKAGGYQLVIVGVGYRNRQVDVTLTDSSGSNLGTITLTPSVTGLKEVTVSAARPVVKQEVDRITYDMQADPESKVYSVLDMMRKVPYLALDADENIQLKGNTDFKILINGKPSSMMERNYKEVLRSMPASSIERIEVITTPPAKYDAEGLAGIINIITYRKIDNGYNGSVNASERFRVGGPGLGGTLSAKFGKLGMTATAGGSQYRVPATLNTVQRSTFGAEASDIAQHGFAKSDSRSGYLSYEVSYEFDTLNLLSAQVNINGSTSSGLTYQTSQLYSRGELLKRYRLDNVNAGSGKGADAAINFQRTSKADKNRLLTLSYRYFGFTNKQDNDLRITDQLNYDVPDYRQVNDQRFAEQTVQVDYVYPIRKLSIEAGLKAIMRLNKSNFGYETALENGGYEVDPAMTNRFRNTQNVFGAYNTYQYNLVSWGFKAGLRIEQTIVDADFFSTDSKVRQNYFNLIPSVSVNRKLKNNSSLNLGYTQRIQRPGIWQLNPFVDRSNPNFERTGNPNLRPAFVNDVQLNYSLNKKGSINFGAGVNTFRDLIFGVAVYNPTTGITRTSYTNSGRARLLMLMTNINYPLTKKWNVSVNVRAAHGRVHGTVNNVPVTNQGIMHQSSVSMGYRFEKEWRLNANVQLNGRNINLQGINNAYTSYSVSLSKDIVKDKLSISAAANNPFTRYRQYKRITNGPDFSQLDYRRDYFRSFNFSLNYKFGKLKDAIKKNKRSIRNDDVQNGN
ncbi:outer membrane beta-barrel family protein [Dyadobacter sandarakinus]|nr:outer membrane beta-barrel family protein [Dyadobacter sandarakinus]